MSKSVFFLLLFAVAFLTGLRARAQGSGVVGDWREPGGSIIRIAPCGSDLCARLIFINPQAPSPFDTHNPDISKRSERLCGLRIGYGFQLKDSTHADNGHLYDPKSGKTYRGEMSSDGETLHLRGYIGIKAFGRTEDWTRVSTSVKGTCG